MLPLDIHVVENMPSNHTDAGMLRRRSQGMHRLQNRSVAMTKAQGSWCVWKRTAINFGNKSSCFSRGKLIKVINCLLENGLCSVEHSTEAKTLSYQVYEHRTQLRNSNFCHVLAVFEHVCTSMYVWVCIHTCIFPGTNSYINFYWKHSDGRTVALSS